HAVEVEWDRRAVDAVVVRLEDEAGHRNAPRDLPHRIRASSAASRCNRASGLLRGAGNSGSFVRPANCVQPLGARARYAPSGRLSTVQSIEDSAYLTVQYRCAVYGTGPRRPQYTRRNAVQMREMRCLRSTTRAIVTCRTASTRAGWQTGWRSASSATPSA